MLRNNRTSEEHPLGIFHPHAPYHHIKKENTGLIEVMGMAILPARLRSELREINTAIRQNRQASTGIHATWVQVITAKYAAEGRPLAKLPESQLDEILRDEVGRVFCGVLEDCGVFKRNAEGKKAFARFLQTVSA